MKLLVRRIDLGNRPSTRSFTLSWPRHAAHLPNLLIQVGKGSVNLQIYPNLVVVVRRVEQAIDLRSAVDGGSWDMSGRYGQVSGSRLAFHRGNA